MSEAPSPSDSDSLTGGHTFSGENVIVIKIGTSTLLSDRNSGCLAIGIIARLVEITAHLQSKGFKVVLVTSGSVGSGSQKFRNFSYPKTLRRKQAMAAVGQVRLMKQYDDLFSAVNVVCAQILLTFSNLSDRSQYINTQNTFSELLKMNVVPIVNENDTVAVEELRFGDNDRLAAMVAMMLQASWFFMLTDVDGLYTSNPANDPNAKRIERVNSFRDIQAKTDSNGSTFGTGGMATKLLAAQMCSTCGIRTVITAGSRPDDILGILEGDRSIGTHFEPNPHPVRGKKRWIIGLSPQGKLIVDEGASEAIKQHKSLFAAGLVSVEGSFEGMCAVGVFNISGHEVARALVNYSSAELTRICKRSSKDIHHILGYAGAESCCHRSNIALME
eukprot:135397_1